MLQMSELGIKIFGSGSSCVQSICLQAIVFYNVRMTNPGTVIQCNDPPGKNLILNFKRPDLKSVPYSRPSRAFKPHTSWLRITVVVRGAEQCRFI